MTAVADRATILASSGPQNALEELIAEVELLLDSDLNRAYALACAAVSKAEAADSVSSLAMAHHLRGLCHFRLGDIPQSLQDQMASLAALQECGDDWVMGRALQAVGAVYGTIGDSSVALEHYEQALAIQSRLGDRWGEARTRNSLAVALLEGRNFRASVAAFEEVAAAFDSLGDALWVGKATINRCIAQVEWVRSGELNGAEAEELLRATVDDCDSAIAVARRHCELGTTLEIYGRQTRSGALIALGMADEALAAADEAMPAATRAGEATVIIELDLNAARALAALGADDDALRRLSTAEELAESAGRDRLLGSAFELRAKICEGRGDLAGALAAQRRYTVISSRAQSHAAELRAKVVRSLLDTQRAELDLAAARFEVENLEATTRRLEALLALSREMVATLDPNLIAHRLATASADLLGASASRVKLESGHTVIHGAIPQQRHVLEDEVVEIPMALDGAPLGTLEAWTRPDDAGFSEMDRSMLNLLANTGATALRNAELYRGIRESRDGERAALKQLREAQSQLLSAQKMEAIGSLAAGIAHEINTPIQFVSDNTTFVRDSLPPLSEAIQARGDLLARIGSDPAYETEVAEVNDLWRKNDCDFLIEELPEAMAETLEGAARVAEIVGAMKEFAHPGTQSKSSVDVNRVVTTTIQVSRNEWKYVSEVETELAEELPLLEGHAGPLGQCLLILLVNAAQAIGEHRDVDEEGKGTITIATSLRDGEIEIRVADDGPGIPPDIADRIFEPFFTTKDVGEGSGQGLSIARSVVVDKHGGRIWVDEGAPGAVFVIRLPLST